jgi:thiol-disulfide isomerase/thioredoxin
MKLTKNTKTILMVIGALVAVLLLISFLTSKSSPKQDGSMYDVQGNDYVSAAYSSYEGFQDSPSPSVMLFHATWCGHCVKYLASGLFDEVSKSSEVHGVKFEKYDADKAEQMREKYDVTSFPTIIGVNARGDKVQFDGNRDKKDDLISFAKSLL